MKSVPIVITIAQMMDGSYNADVKKQRQKGVHIMQSRIIIIIII